jgi:hypothetical protein
MDPLYKANFRRHRSDPEEGPEADSETQCLKIYYNQIRDEIRLESHTTNIIIIITPIISILLLLILLPPPPTLLLLLLLPLLKVVM